MSLVSKTASSPASAAAWMRGSKVVTTSTSSVVRRVRKSGPRRHHPVGEGAAGPRRRRLRQHRRVRARLARLRGGQVALLLHQPDDDLRARLRPREVVGRREARRCAQQPGQHRRLGRVHLGRRLAEVALGRRLEAGGAGAEIGAVQVDRQDLVLGELPLERQRRRDLLDLALPGPAVVEPDELRDLLGDRRAALHRLPGAQVDERGAGGALQVDAEVPVEAAVLGRDDGVDQVRRHLVGPGQPELLAAPGEGLARGVEQRHRPALARVEQPLEVGQLAHVIGGADRQHDCAGDRRPGADPPEQPEDPAEEASDHALQEAKPRLGLRPSLACVGHAPLRSARSAHSLRGSYADSRRSASRPAARPPDVAAIARCSFRRQSPPARQYSPISWAAPPPEQTGSSG